MKVLNYHIHANIFSLLVLLFCILCFSGCSRKAKTSEKTASAQPLIHSETAKNHQWYSFTTKDFIKIEKPQNSTNLPYVPWTEAVRISSANNTTGENENNRAFAVVNRLGILTFNGNKVTLSEDINLFTDRTAGNLVFVDDKPVFSVYKSAFFNNTISNPVYKNDGNQHLFLVQFDDAAGISYPLINSSNLVHNPDSEVTDYYWDGYNFDCSVKALKDGKIDFTYIKWQPSVPLLALSPANAENSVNVREISAEEFRKAKQQLDYKDAPERIKNLLAGFSGKIPFVLEVKSAGGSSPRIYYNQVTNSKAKELNAKAIITRSWSAALFEDGTLYIEGALPGKYILRGGKPVAVRLPKLPAGYVYSDFVISETTLYAAWEQTSFYKTCGAGFLSVDLDETLYKKLSVRN